MMITKIDAGMMERATPAAELFYSTAAGRRGSATVRLNDIRFERGWIALYGPVEGNDQGLKEGEKPIVQIFVWKTEGRMQVSMSSTNGHVANVLLHWPKDRNVRPFAEPGDYPSEAQVDQEGIIESRILRIGEDGKLKLLESGAKFLAAGEWWDLGSLEAEFRKTRVDSLPLSGGWSFSFLPERKVKDAGKSKIKPALRQVFRQVDENTMEIFGCIRTSRGIRCWGPEQKLVKRTATAEERKAVLTEAGDAASTALITEADAKVTQLGLEELFAQPDAGPTVVQ